MEFRCPSCNTVLADNLAKCPSCGLPLKPQVRQGRPRSLVGGLLLLTVVVLGVFQAALVVMDPGAAAQPGLDFGVGSFVVSGVVRDEAGLPVANASVSTRVGSDANETNATTDSSGQYRLAGVPAGVYDVTARDANRSATLRVFVAADEAVDLRLPAANATTSGDHESLRTLLVWTQACGGILLALCVLPLAGAIACYRRRRWGLALTGAIVGLFVALPLSLFVGLIALVVVATGRSEFGA